MAQGDVLTAMNTASRRSPEESQDPGLMVPPDQKDFARIQDLDGKEQGNHITPQMNGTFMGSLDHHY